MHKQQSNVPAAMGLVPVGYKLLITVFPHQEMLTLTVGCKVGS